MLTRQPLSKSLGAVSLAVLALFCCGDRPGGVFEECLTWSALKRPSVDVLQPRALHPYPPLACRAGADEIDYCS